MCIFEKMLDDAVREDFLAYKRRSISCSNEELEIMKAYLLSERYADDIKRLMAGEFFLEPPLQIALRQGRKTRLVYSFRNEDKTLLRLMAFVLHDYDGLFPDNLYSFCRKKRASDLILRLRNTPGLEDKFIFRADVRNFSESIDGEILISQVERLFAHDPRFLAFLKRLLRWRTYRTREGEVRHDGPAWMSGMPLGNFLGNVYLMELDQIFAERGALYGRFTDDIILYADTEEQLQEFWNIFQAEMERKHLPCHPEKTMLLPPGSPVEFLGMEITGRRVDISTRALRKWKWKLRKAANQVMRRKKEEGLSDEEAMRLMILAANRKFFGKIPGQNDLNWCSWTMPVLTETAGLKKLDAVIQNNIRYVGSGKKSDARYRIRFEQLHALGYRSLVHLYYRRFESDWHTVH